MSNSLLLYIAFASILIAIVLIAVVPLVLLRTNKHRDIDLLASDSNSGGLILRMIRPLLRLYTNLLKRELPAVKAAVLRIRLTQADLVMMLNPKEFVALRRFSLLFGLFFGWIIVQLLRMQDAANIFALLAGLATLGHMYPDIWLNDKVKVRKNQIEKAFPFFLDLLVLMMRAGMPFAGAVQQGINKINDGPLKREFIRYQRDIRTGVSRADALESLAARIDIPAITNFASAIIQAEETGGSITNLLANQAQQRRKERFLRAEKKANEAPVKMLAPLVGLLFPITFMIISVPIIVQFLDSGLADKLMK